MDETEINFRESDVGDSYLQVEAMSVYAQPKISNVIICEGLTSEKSSFNVHIVEITREQKMPEWKTITLNMSQNKW